MLPEAKAPFGGNWQFPSFEIGLLELCAAAAPALQAKAATESQGPCKVAARWSFYPEIVEAKSRSESDPDVPSRAVRKKRVRTAGNSRKRSIP